MKPTWNRRDFLKKSSAATLAALAAGAPVASMLSGCGKSKLAAGTADTVILLWIAGGMAHTETFDPKRYTPYESGSRTGFFVGSNPATGVSVDILKQGAIVSRKW